MQPQPAESWSLAQPPPQQQWGQPIHPAAPAQQPAVYQGAPASPQYPAAQNYPPPAPVNPPPRPDQLQYPPAAPAPAPSLAEPTKAANNPPPAATFPAGAAAAGGGGGLPPVAPVNKLYPAIATAVFFVLVAIGLAIALGVVGYRYMHRQGEIDSAVAAANLARTCNVTTPANANVAFPARVGEVFNPYTEDELNQISAFVINAKGLAASEPATMTGADWLFALDFMPSSKANNLAYLDGSSATFEGRYCRAIIFHMTAAATSKVVEYKVGPIPSFPIDPNTPIVPIVQEAVTQLTDIPYIMRPISNGEYALLYALIAATCQSMDPLMQETYGGNYADGTMSTTDSSPRGYDRSARTTWFWLYWNLPGMYHLSMGIDLLIDHTDLNPNNWHVIQICYNSQCYTTPAALMTAYTANVAPFTKFTYPIPSTNDWTNAPLFSTMMRRGPARVLDTPGSLPTTAPQGGLRYAVNNRQVSWMGWDIHLGNTIVGGLVFNDIRFRGDRIVYELALQDAFAGYSGYNPIQATSTYSDAGWGLGVRRLGLVAGSDCPAWATFIDSSFFVQNTAATTIQRTGCIWEQPDNIAIMRHYDQDFTTGSGYMFVGGYPRTSLFIRTSSTVYNYDYIITLILHMDGTIEVNNAATGYPQGEFWPTIPASQALEDGFSTRVQDKTMCSLHDHMFGYKVDVDVLGTANTLIRNDLQIITRDLPYVFPGAGTHQKKMVKTPILTEVDLVSSYIYNPTAPTNFAFSNPSSANSGKNKWGNPRTYGIVLPGTIAQLNDPTAPWMPAVEWTRRSVTVTKRNEIEYYSSRPQYDMQAPSQPIINFSSYTNGESLDQQDLVAWVTVGTIHMPGAEDVPVTTTSSSGVSFYIKPSNYFDESPATDLSNYYYRTGQVTKFPGVPDFSHDLLPDPSVRCFDPSVPPEIK